MSKLTFTILLQGPRITVELFLSNIFPIVKQFN